MVLSEATKKGLDVGDVVGGVGVEDDDGVEVHSDAFQAFVDLVDDFNEPTGGSAAALRYHKPLEQRAWCAERRQKGGVLVDSDLVKLGDQVEEEKNAPFSKQSKTSSMRGMGSCPRELMAFSSCS